MTSQSISVRSRFSDEVQVYRGRIFRVWGRGIVIREGVVALEFWGSTKLETYEERSPAKLCSCKVQASC